MFSIAVKMLNTYAFCIFQTDIKIGLLEDEKMKMFW